MMYLNFPEKKLFIFGANFSKFFPKITSKALARSKDTFLCVAQKYKNCHVEPWHYHSVTTRVADPDPG